MTELINLREEEITLRKKRQEVLENIEKKRLEDEKDNFIKEVQNQRLRGIDNLSSLFLKIFDKNKFYYLFRITTML